MTERDTVKHRSENSEPPERPLPPPRVGGESLSADELAGAATSADVDHHAPAAAASSSVIGSSEPLAISVASTEGEPVAGAGAPLAGRGGRIRIADRVFLGLSSGAAGFVIALVVLIGLFLIIKAVPAIRADKVNFLTSSDWSLTPASTDAAGKAIPADLRFGIAPLLYSTVIMSLIALLIAVPIAIGIALFITQYAPKRLAKPVASVIDLLAAIPSIVYGIWGIFELAPKLTPVQNAISHIPGGFFANDSTTHTIFDGSVVLAVMILPIITAISRDVFDRTPRANVEAALALGATKWEMIRMAVLPYGRSGVVSGSMLGLGRALGETIAVYYVVAAVGGFSSSIFGGGETFASKIANNAAEFNNPLTTGAYLAAGLVLFILTFLVNSAARAIVNRKKDFS